MHSIIQEIDADTGEKLHGSKIRKVFSSAWIFAPDIKKNSAYQWKRMIM